MRFFTATKISFSRELEGVCCNVLNSHYSDRGVFPHHVWEGFTTPVLLEHHFPVTALQCSLPRPLPHTRPRRFGSRTERVQYPKIYVWQWSIDAGSNIALDFFLTHMLMATLMTWAGTGAARKDIHERKLDVLDASLLQRGIWRYTPVLIANTFLRGLAMGFYWTFLAGVPVFLLTWAAIGNGTMDGWPYILFKGM